jgi:hypothetical protein
MSRPSIYSNCNQMNETYSNKWALQTNKHCNQPEMIPKIQQYKEYQFNKRNPEDVFNYQTHFLKSDNIALKNEIQNRNRNRKTILENLLDDKNVEKNNMNNTLNFNLKNEKENNKLTRNKSVSKYGDDRSERSKMCNTAREKFSILSEKSK